ncbi:MAG: hypothetical protein MSC30_18150 [Gaiellaceae bacterium MAG52_C11]|nr:hypothetical protein [Candidatus Gaiellasilicea maunaloa]
MSVGARELFRRHSDNPILTAVDWPDPVNVVFNPAAAIVDGETVLLARVEALTGISHLSVARSANGIDDWTVASEPLLEPQEGIESEQWGFEDARAVWVAELECFVITCTAYGPAGPAVYLATTKDFVSVERKGIVVSPEDKNAALLPERVDGKWILFHRPTTGFGGVSQAGIALSRSDDLEHWTAPEPVMQPRSGAWWDSLRIGIGPPLMKTEHGWLLIYHGVKETVAGAIYRVGLALLDLEEPTRVLRRADDWILGPLEAYERQGDVANALFPCGVIQENGGELRLYYGAADTSICLATGRLDELLERVLAAPQPE